MRGPLAAALALSCALAAAAVPRAQQEAPVFRTRVEAVEIDAFVTDAQGNPIIDLTIDDFEVFEDGAPQAITSMSLVNIPLEREERPMHLAAPIEPDVFTNTGPEGRLYVIALDSVGAAYALRTRHFMRRFLEQHLAANDAAAIVCVTRCRGADTQDFTSNRRLLLESIEKYSGGLGGSQRDRMRALRDLTEFMAKLRGRRKTMIYITSGLFAGEGGEDVFGVLDYRGGSRSIEFEDLHAAMAAATRGNISIYPVDPVGLSPGGSLGESEGGSSLGGWGVGGLSQMMDMRALGEATGGFALVNSNSFQQTFERIVRENSTYYVLGYTSTNDRRDGRYRRLQVRVKRPGLQVRARNGYLAPIRDTPATPPAPDLETLAAPVADALSLPLPTRTLPMAAFAAPFKGTGREARVAVALELDAGRLGLASRDGLMAGDIQVAMRAISETGKLMPGQQHRIALALKPDTWRDAQSQGLRVVAEMALPPGRYQLRVAGGNVNGPAGSVMVDLQVPDFTKAPLVMSGIALTSSATSAAVTSTPGAPLRDLLPGPPTAARVFDRGDRLTLYTEIYENGRNRAAHTVSITAQLRSDDGRVLQTVEEDRSSKELDGSTGGYGFRAELSLDVDPGLYVIHVEARANVSRQPTVSRDIQIRVR